MLKELKELKIQLALKNNDVEHDNEGRAIINLRVKNDDNFLSPYSTDENGALSGEVSEFIEHSLMEVHHNERIHFKIHGDTIDEKEQKEYVNAIHSHYESCYKETILSKRRLMKISLIMAFIAILTLSAMIFLEVSGMTNAVLVEVIDIIAWVFMWEAVDIFFLRCAVLRQKERRYLCLLESVIEFLPLN